MKNHQPRRLFWAVVTGMYTIATRLRAFEANDILAYSIGPLLIRPQLEISERYDSNIFYSSLRKVADFRTDILPGVNVVIGKPERLALSLTYQLDQSLYVERSELNGLGQFLNAQFTYQGARLWVQGTDRFQFLENQVLGQELNFQNLRNQLVRYNTLADNYRVGYQITEKTAVYVQGTHESYDYNEPSFVLDYDNIMGTVGFQKAVFSKTRLFSEVYYGQTATGPNTDLLPKSPHSEFLGGFFGFEGSFTEKLVGMVKAGYESRWFSDGSEGVDGPVVGSTITYRMSEKRSATLQYNRRSNVSVQNGTAAYVSDAVNLNFQQAIGTRDKWMARATGGYYTYAYQGIVFANRADSLYSIGASLDYLFRTWMKAGISYDYYKFESRSQSGLDFGLSNYDSHRLTMRLSVGY